MDEVTLTPEQWEVANEHFRKSIAFREYWRKHTCEECGWARLVKNYCGNEMTMFICRHRSSDIMWNATEPACPAFVPRGEMP